MKSVQVFWVVCVIGIIYAEIFDAFTKSLNNVWRAIKDALRKPLRARSRKTKERLSLSTEPTTYRWVFETKADNLNLLASGKPVIIPVFTSPRTRPTRQTSVTSLVEMQIKDAGYKK